MPFIYRPGQIVADPGVYRVNHSADHDMSMWMTLRAGDTFPPCPACGTTVSYSLARSAPAPDSRPAPGE